MSCWGWLLMGLRGEGAVLMDALQTSFVIQSLHRRTRVGRCKLTRDKEASNKYMYLK